MQRSKTIVLTILLIFIFILGSSSCEIQKTQKEAESSDQSSSVQIDPNIDKNLVGVFLLVYDQRKGEEKRDVSDIINSGFRMTAHFYEDGRGYLCPGAGIEEFTWGNGKIIQDYREMTYTFEDDLLLLEEIESGSRYWYKRTDEELDEYPALSPDDLP